MLFEIIGLLLGVVFTIAFVLWVIATSGCRRSRDFYEALDRPSEAKREIDKLPIMLRKQAD